MIPGQAQQFFEGAAAASGGSFQIDRSLRFNSADSAYLNRTPSSASNQKTWTWSGWVKQVVVSGTAQTHILAAGSSPYFQFYFVGPTLFVETSLGYIEPTQKFRDPSAWYHFVVAVDTTQATATNRIRFYVNGEEVTDFATDQRSSITQNADLAINSTVEHRIGAQTAATAYSNMYLAEVHFVDGTQLAPTDFGEYDDNNNWNPKAYSGGSYGTNGFRLDFSDNSSASALGTDSAGSNDWTVNNISVASGSGNDSLIDTPTNYTAASGNNGGNYCTLNSVETGDYSTLSNGNLDQTGGATDYSGKRGTFSMTTGKWYWEVTINGTSGVAPGPGIQATDVPNYESPVSTRRTYYNDGTKFDGTQTSYGASFTTGDVIGVAFDADAGSLTFYKNGTTQGVAFSSLSDGPYSPLTVDYNGSSTSHNFGQRPFAYTPPTGYLSLCTQNLSDPTVANGSSAMSATLYSGDGTNGRAITTGHSSDLVWIKARNQIDGHIWCDIVRGTDKIIKSNSTAAELTTTNSVTAFNSDGFTVGSNASDAQTNQSGFTYVAWSWDGGDSTGSNTDGSITSNVRANTSAGFSIVSYTGDGVAGATVGHGLNDQLGLLVVKNRSNSTTIAWGVKHSSLYSNAGNWLRLDSAQAATAESAGAGSLFNATNPTSSVFTLGPRDTTNTSGDNYIAYCWAPVSGFSAFGSYVGSQNFPFVNCGFRPRYLLIKPTNLASGWQVYDSERSQFNVADLA